MVGTQLACERRLSNKGLLEQIYAEAGHYGPHPSFTSLVRSYLVADLIRRVRWRLAWTQRYERLWWVTILGHDFQPTAVVVRARVAPDEGLAGQRRPQPPSRLTTSPRLGLFIAAGSARQFTRIERF